MAKVKVSGIRQSQAKLNALIGDIQGRKVVRALQSAMIIGGTQSALYTPIDTSTLINSQFREIVISGMRVTGRVGYTANYAMYVHDPEVKQTFRRSTAKKEFLKLGFEEAKDQIDAVVKREMKL
ncbi:HK97 gp10 family phage protein [Pectobacterium polonicum]|uniref:HK97 gp10 family phage protein n=1 Tax=Pectobacterium polonicum TaxID=2485124 RepID=UPI00375462A7